ncbi:MAG: 2-oxo acid dehydrogenase subunit E2, partial [Actinobacteria bacterium]
MATDIVMPRLSDSMEEGTILRWLKSPGDQVALGEELVEIETDKANMVYEAPGTGTLIEIVAEEGDTLPIGQVIARVGEADEKPSGEGAAAEREAAEEADDDRRSPSPVHGSAASQSSRVRAAEAPSALSPSFTSSTQRSAARRIATENGLDLSALAGSGPGGRIIKADVERAIAAGPAPVAPPAPATAPSPGAPAEPTPGARERPETAKGAVSHEGLTKLQQTVARRMAESKATAPHFYLSAEVDMTRAVSARARIKAEAADGDLVPSFNDLVVKACAIALREHPRANGA